MRASTTMAIPAVLMAVAVCLLAARDARPDEETHRRALETLLKIFDMEERSKQSIDQMVTFHIQQDPRLGLHRNVLRKFYAKYMSWEKLKGELIAIYMEEFSEEEVRELIAFYKTPTGRKAVEKMPLLMEKCGRIGNRRLMEHIGEWNEMLREETERLRKSGESGRAERRKDGVGTRGAREEGMAE